MTRWTGPQKRRRVSRGTTPVKTPSKKKTRAGHRTKSRTKAGTEPEKKAEIVTCRVRKNSASGGQRKVITRLPRTSAGRGAYGATFMYAGAAAGCVTANR